MDENTKKFERLRNKELFKQLLIRLFTIKERLEDQSLTESEREYFQKEYNAIVDSLNEESKLPTLKMKQDEIRKKNLEIREKQIIEKGEDVEFFQSVRKVLDMFDEEKRELEKTIQRKREAIDKQSKKQDKKRKKMKINKKLYPKYVNGIVPDHIFGITIYLRRIKEASYTNEEKDKFRDLIEVKMLELSEELKKDDDWEMWRIYAMMKAMWGIEATDKFKKIFKNLD